MMVRNFAVVPAHAQQKKEYPNLPDSIKRVGEATKFPNEYPGQIYAFNWCLNGDGVTPLKRSSFRIVKPLDLRVAGLPTPKVMPLKVTPAPPESIPEAGEDDEEGEVPKLTFERFDEISQIVRDYLSLSDHIYCPEGHAPGTRTGVRIITNSAKMAPDYLAYLERAPRLEPPESLPITVYAFEGINPDDPNPAARSSFAGFAIEEMEFPLVDKKADRERDDWHEGTGYQYQEYEAKSVASIVVADVNEPSLEVIAAGIELCHKALIEDQKARQAEKDAAGGES